VELVLSSMSTFVMNCAGPENIHIKWWQQRKSSIRDVQCIVLSHWSASKFLVQAFREGYTDKLW